MEDRETSKGTKRTSISQMTKKASEFKVNPLSFSTSDRATKRVIAPYVRIIRKGQKAQITTKTEESKQFSYYLQKKPSVLMRNLSNFLSDSVDLPSVLNETSEVLKGVTRAQGKSVMNLWQSGSTDTKPYKSSSLNDGIPFVNLLI